MAGKRKSILHHDSFSCRFICDKDIKKVANSIATFFYYIVEKLFLKEIFHSLIGNHLLIENIGTGLWLLTILITFEYARPSVEPSWRVATAFFAISYRI